MVVDAPLSTALAFPDVADQVALLRGGSVVEKEAKEPLLALLIFVVLALFGLKVDSRRRARVRYHVLHGAAGATLGGA